MPIARLVIKASQYVEKLMGLSFTLHGGSQELETQWREKQANQGLYTDKLLSTGYAMLHLFFAAALYHQNRLPLALVTLFTALYHGALAIFITRHSQSYIKYKNAAYAFSIIWSMISSHLHATSVQIDYCSAPGGVLFWIAKLVSSGLPWFALHALVFPLPMAQAVVAHLLSISFVTYAARGRCGICLSQCPGGGPHFVGLRLWLSRVFDILSIASPGASKWLAGGNEGALSACVSLYFFASALTYFGVLHMIWLSEHKSRLAFLANTEEINVEWSLEQMGRMRLAGAFIGMELMVLLGVLVQANGFLIQI